MKLLRNFKAERGRPKAERAKRLQFFFNFGIFASIFEHSKMAAIVLISPYRSRFSLDFAFFFCENRVRQKFEFCI